MLLLSVTFSASSKRNFSATSINRTGRDDSDMTEQPNLIESIKELKNKCS